MTELFRLSIVTPEKVFYEGDIKSLVIPGSEGYLGILPNHAPLITALKPGKIEFRDSSDREHTLAVSGGFLEVSRNQVNLLVEAIEFAGDIDLERARTAYQLAKDRLAAAGDGDQSVDIAAEQAALERAANRIKIHREAH